MPSTFTLHDRPCIDARDLYNQSIAMGWPLDPWWGKANSFKLPIGEEPGIGYLLMLRDDLDRLTLSSTHDLKLDDGSGQPAITHKSLSIIESRCVTPGMRADKAACYAVTVADRRHRIRQIPAGTAYNVRDQSGTGYLTATLNGGTAWTWQEMVDELWDFIDGGSSLTLPYSPQGKPENFAFWNEYAWHALNMVARRLGCAIVYNTTTDAFSIVELGATDTAAVAALDRIDGLRIWDTEAMGLPNARLPAKVNVVYPIYPAPTDGSSPFVVTSVSVGTASPYTDSAVYINGDLGSPAESGQDLSARATERAAKWYQAANDSVSNPIQRVYTGLIRETAILPGKRIKAIAWYDRGDGLKTEIYRGPGICPPDEFDGKPCCDSCKCGDPGDPPEGWTASDDACYTDTIEVRCNSGTTEYRLVRLFIICGKFRTWTGPWGTTNPPDEPA